MPDAAPTAANAITDVAAGAAAAAGRATSTQLIVFSDDWGRHPSSCQHLIGQLLPRYPVLWVNTIGTRAPKLSWEDVGKATKKLWQWLRPAEKAAPGSVWVPRDEQGNSALSNLTVITPAMYPGFRKPWMRRLNAKLIARAVHRALGPRDPASTQRRVVITTVPITADLPGLLDVDRWIYYCVDDFSVWPGLDGSILDIMDLQLATKADAILAVSQTLRQRLKGWGCESQLLTHGIDLKHWGWVGPARPPLPLGEGRGEGQESSGAGHAAERPSPSPGLADPGISATLSQGERGKRPAEPALPPWWPREGKPVLLFWGVVDQRLDLDWCRALAGCGTLVLLGPQQSPHPQLAALDHIIMPGPAAYDDLPALAQAASVLVMPYADLPVTRALQPLKFKEYLATGQPVVTRRLPATEEWADAADVVDSIETLVAAAKQRILDGAPAAQTNARQRLADESWAAKAALLEAAIAGGR